jgi:hypothetical protein
VLVLLSWFIVLLVENSRIPFDDPNTHLELTMIHEVMVLDHSGPAFGVILYGAALKLYIMGALFLHVLLPLRVASPALDWLVRMHDVPPDLRIDALLSGQGDDDLGLSRHGASRTLAGTLDAGRAVSPFEPLAG